MAEQKSIPIIGGPKEGQWWPADNGSPRFAIRKPFSVTPEVLPPTKPQDDIFRYERFNVTHQITGKSFDVFAPADWTYDAVCARLDELAPDGFN